MPIMRFLPYQMGNWLRWLVLSVMGADLHPTAVVNMNVKIYSPKNLRMERNTVLAEGVDCYNVDMIEIKENSTISQRTFLCTASHDFNRESFDLITKPILIKENTWVAAECAVLPGAILGPNQMYKLRSVIK